MHLENGGLDGFLLQFEKFVSEQEVSFFSQQGSFSKFIVARRHNFRIVNSYFKLS